MVRPANSGGSAPHTMAGAVRLNNAELAADNARLQLELRRANERADEAERRHIGDVTQRRRSDNATMGALRQRLRQVHSTLQGGLQHLSAGLEDLSRAVNQVQRLVDDIPATTEDARRRPSDSSAQRRSAPRPSLAHRTHEANNASTLSPIVDRPGSESPTGEAAAEPAAQATRDRAAATVHSSQPRNVVPRRSAPFAEMQQWRGAAAGGAASRFVACTAAGSAQRRLHTIDDDTATPAAEADEAAGALAADAVDEGGGGDAEPAVAHDELQRQYVNTQRGRHVRWQNDLSNASEVRTPSPAVPVASGSNSVSENDMFDTTPSADAPPPSAAAGGGTSDAVAMVAAAAPAVSASSAADTTFTVDEADATGGRADDAGGADTPATAGDGAEQPAATPLVPTANGAETAPAADGTAAAEESPATSGGSASARRKRRSRDAKEPPSKKQSPAAVALHAAAAGVENSAPVSPVPVGETPVLADLPPRPPPAASSSGSRRRTVASSSARSKQRAEQRVDDDTPTGGKTRTLPRRCADESTASSTADSTPGNGGGRSRRARNVVSYKEPSIHKKLRR